MTALEKNNLTGLEIAVIGMVGRFPGAKDVNEFWENLKNGVESISFFSDEELSDAGVDAELLNSPNYIKAKGIVPGFEYFDSSFFGYIPVETGLMDPQVRIFHECAWEALESGGYVPGVYKGRIGVYAGASSHLRWEILSFFSEKAVLIGDFAAWQLYDKDFMSTRISYNLNLSGPSISVYTACSTSLVAIHLACQGLLGGECHLALAGGITVGGKMGYLYQPGIILAPDGHCRAFAADANGTVMGEGVGIVLLKPLEKALAHGDYILAVIKSSAINNDGKGKVGYTAPSVKEQAAVIRNAHRLARIKPETITYIETHGTGTNLGDPVEMEALIQAFNTDKKGFCRIGSVKSNLGHTDVTAGVAGFIKTVLALKYKSIPPTLHVEKSNPKIDFQNSPFVVNTSLVRWKTQGFPLRAGVSSFGAGGTNAHVILEEAPDAQSEGRRAQSAMSQGRGEVPSTSREYQLILLSAKTGTALDRMTANLEEYLKKNPGINLADAAYTLQVGREAFEYRRTILCQNVEEALEALTPGGDTSRDLPHLHPSYVKTDNKPVVFMFSGQGSQYVNMGLGIYQTEPVFRQEIDRCFEILKPLMGYDIKEILYPYYLVSKVSEVSEVSGDIKYPSAQWSLTNQSPLERGTPNPRKGGGMSNINQTEIAQPLLFVFEYALAKLLIKWGIKPYAMMGHSIGEYVAACLSGVFSLEDALEIVALRGRLMQKMPLGAMLGVSLPEKELTPLLNREISLAAVNSPSLCVVSGPHEVIENFAKKLEAEAHESRPLHTSHAFHSQMMDPILKEFEEKISGILLSKPRIPYISNLTGKWITVRDAGDPGYWAKHLRETVRFSSGLEELLKKEEAVFLEVGPGKALSTFARQHPGKKSGHIVVDLVRHPKQEEPDHRFLLDKISRLWLGGVKIDWPGFYSAEKRCRISLPTYSFERLHYPIAGDPFKFKVEMLSKSPRLEKRKEISDWFYVPSWEKSIISSPGPVEPPGQFNWLVFTDAHGLGSGLIKKLAQDEGQVIMVKAASSFSRKNEREFTVNPRQENDYKSLFDVLHQLKKTPHKILHLWSVTGNKERKPGVEGIDRVLEAGFYSLLHIARAIGRQGIGDDIQIGVVTDNMQEVTGEEELCPEKATVLGAVKVISLEYPNIRCSSVDIVLPQPGSPRERKLLNNLAVEFTSSFSDKVVAYRGNFRWVQIIKPVQLDKPVEAKQLLREEGVYLITGGLGGIGLTLAEHLAKSVKARLILTGRSSFPAREKWEEWLSTHDDRAQINHKIRKLLEIEKSGGEVLVIRADVADPERMREAIALTQEQFGRINGVIHSAGLPDGGLIQGRTREMTETVFDSKVRGTLILDRIFKDEPLDFFVLCSSLASILAPPGQVAYSAANAFLDAFAVYKTSVDESRFTTAINWDTWQKVGMAVDAVKKLTGAEDIPEPRPVKVKHPLFDYCLEKNANEKVYVSNFNLKKYWVLDEHRLIGKPTLPGTGCVELARAAFEDHTGNEFIEMHEVYFLTPLRMEEGEQKEVRTILKKQGNRYKFTICSRVNPVEVEDRFVEHALGELVSMEAEPVKTHDIKEIMARCNEKEVIVTEDMLSSKRTGDMNIELGPRWKNLKRVNFGANQVLLLLELSQEFAGDIGIYKLHPALLDTAVGYFNAANVIGEANLPFFYKRLTVKGPIPRKLYSYQEYEKKTRAGEKEKILKYSITLIDEEGRELVDIEDYQRLAVSEQAMARLSGSDSRLQEEQQESSISPNVFKEKEEELLGHGLLPTEGIEVFRRILGRRLPQVAVSTRDFAALGESTKTLMKQRDILKGPEPGKSRGPLHPRPEMKKAYVAPGSEIEKKLVEIWQNFFGIDQVGIQDDFFELGGDSLKIMSIVFTIHQTLDVEVPLGEFFNNPTIVGVAEYINDVKGSVYTAIEPVEKREYYPASSAQKRMYILQQLEREITNYNLPAAFVLTGVLDGHRLEEAFQRLIQRHEGLRTSFIIAGKENEPVQRVHCSVEFGIKRLAVAADTNFMNDIVRPFDLSQAPLFRVGLIREEDKKNIIVIEMHHIISDGVTLGVLAKEFMTLFAGEELPPLKLQYKDFSMWQNKFFETEKMKKQETFWLEKFKGEIPLLNMPTNYPRPSARDFAGDLITFNARSELTRQLKNLARESNTTLFMVLLAAYNVLLFQYTGQEDILVGSPVAGRVHPDLENIIGMFANTLALRNYPHPTKSFKRFLKNVKENTLKAFENQDYQFEMLVDKLHLQRNAGRNPLFDTMFALQNMSIPEIKLKNLELTPYKFVIGMSHFDIMLSGMEMNEGIVFSLEYCNKLFGREMMGKFSVHFINLLKEIVKNPGIELSRIDIRSEAEKDKISKFHDSEERGSYEF